MHGVSIGSQAIASFSPKASKTGARVLKNGGNAIDAAVASSLVFGIAEPGWSGIGGGGFILAHLSTGENIVLDYRETAPSQTDPAYYTDEKKTSIGYRSIGIPGTIAGLFSLQKRYGKMQLEDVVQFAIDCASEGIKVTELWEKSMHQNFDAALDKLRRSPYSTEVFLRNNRPYQTGERLIQKDLAKTLRTIVKEGPQVFYEGEIADVIEEDMVTHNAFLRGNDLADYEVKNRDPLEIEFRDKYKIITMPPPGSGASLIEALHILETLMEHHSEFSSEDLLVETLAQVMEDRARYLCDPDFHDVPVELLVSQEYAKNVAQNILNTARTATSADKQGGTAHVTALDKEGNAVSITETIECFMGSGVTIPDTGILMNDEIHDFSFNSDSVNYIQPGKRPRSSMTPTVILKNGNPFLVLGATGGTRILTALIQVLFHRLQLNQDIVRAVHHPRLHVQGKNVYVEHEGMTRDISKPLHKQGFSVECKKVFSPCFDGYDVYYGAVEAIEVLSENKVLAVSDPRKYYGLATV